jgi:lipopolysaccharide/colanic/teichoic acid biosynthesis glycosyltransferase
MNAKRAFDIVASLAGLVVLTPVFATAAVVGAAHFRKNPFFADTRVGKDGELFTMYKFRSMTDDIDADGNLLPDHQRRTKWGSFVKMTGIDEFPQLVNILKGEMSVVGPRPNSIGQLINQVPEHYWDAITSVKPGLTGPWQVAAIGSHDQMPFERRYQLDASYAVQNYALIDDMKLIVKTVPSFLWGHDGRGLLIPNSFEK